MIGKGFHPFEVTVPHIVYACLGGFTVLFGMFSLFLREKLYIGEACWAFIFGIIIGPYGANIFNPRSWAHHDQETINTITLEVTRVILAIGVFAIGVELPKAYMARHWRSLFFLLVPVMTWGWFVSAGLIYALIPGLNFLSSLAVAACLTPTDPILAAAIIGGKYADKHVPAHLRHMLAAESGCNDGAAFPFLYIALYLILDSDDGRAVRDWFLVLWLYQVVLGIAIGSFLGFGFRHLMRFCQRKELIDRQSYVAQYIALAMLTVGITTLLGSDDLLAAFTCGTAFAWDGFFNRQTEESVFSSVIDLLFNVAAFVYVGAWMPFSQFQGEFSGLTVWRLVVIAILVLLLRRLPIMIALYKWIPDVKTFREALFSGHFGPIGIGAVFISTLAAEKLPHYDHTRAPTNQTEMLAATIQPIVAFMVLCSITIHGLSIPSFSLGRRVRTASRTWSRHAPPDWTNQTRMVERGENIVINRDIERGLVQTEDDKSAAADSGLTATSFERVGENALNLGHQSGHAQGTANGRAMSGGDAEVVTEWKEGRDKVAEHKRVSGGDVETGVIPNAYGPNSRSAARLGDESNRDQSVDSSEQLRHAVAGATHEGHGYRSPDDRAVEEEGWASDGSAAASKPDAVDRRQRSKPSKQHLPSSSRPVSAGRSRRRSSFRGTMLGHARQLMKAAAQRKASESDPDPVVERRHASYPPRRDGHRQRGDRGALTTDPGAGGSRLIENALQNLRLESLRQRGSRDASPASSVRFVRSDGESDRAGSGCATPQVQVVDAPPRGRAGARADDGIGVSADGNYHVVAKKGSSGGNTTGRSTPRGSTPPISQRRAAEEASAEEGVDSRNRVTFELPAGKN